MSSSNSQLAATAAADRLLESLDSVGEAVLTRRRTLQIGLGVAAGSIAASKIPFVRDIVGLGTAEATQVPSTVVLVYLDGGNDGLNTLVPLTDARYQDYRGGLAIAGNSTLPINVDYGLHPSLPFVQSMWASGKAAFVRGVGYANNNLSHFTSVDHWHAGYGAENSPVVPSPHSGWVGRFADTIGPSNPFTSVAIGPHTPVSMRGNSVAALQIPIPQSQLFGNNQNDLNELWVSNALRSINATGTGTGTLGTGLAARAVSAINVAPQVSTAWNGADGTPINRQMTMAANLINARLGVRVISVAFDGFDTHAQQLVTHSRLLGDLNAALSGFFQRLDPTLKRSVVVMTYSEFGRRVRANNSAGTDHGSSSIGMVLGENVAGGIYGDEPGLTTLDPAGNSVVTTDFRRLYSTMLAGWLGADPDPILGASHTPLPLFAAQPGIIPTTSTTSTTRAAAPPAAPSTAVPVTRGPAPDSPGVTVPGRAAPGAAGPGLTTSTTTPTGQLATEPDSSTSSSAPSTTPSTVAAAGSIVAAAATPTTTSVLSLAAVTPSVAATAAPSMALASNPTPPATGPIGVVGTAPSSGVIVPTDVVFPGNGAVVAPSPTVPGETVVVPVGPQTTSTVPAAPVGPAQPTPAPTTSAKPTASTINLQLTARSLKSTISASVSNGPLRNDTRVELFDQRDLTRSVAIRYLNNRTRPGIVTRTSGAVTFTGLKPGRYVVRVFAFGNSSFVRELMISVR